MIAFWILAPVMVICALGLLFARKAVHCAMLLAVVMISLAVLYAVQDAPFLFAVQIIVYTGAILMLFLFVLMLVGVDASDSVVETIRGQRLFAVLVGLLFGATLVIGVAQVSLGVVTGLDEANADGNVPGIARLLVHEIRLRLRGDLGAAHHRCAGRDGARASRAPHPQADPERPRRTSGCATTQSTGSTPARCRHRVSSLATTPSTLPPCCPTGLRRMPRSPGCSPHGARSSGLRAAPDRWSGSAAVTRRSRRATIQGRQEDENAKEPGRALRRNPECAR